VDAVPTVPAGDFNAEVGATNATGWFPPEEGAALFSPIYFDDVAEVRVPSTCYFDADVAGYKAGGVLTPTQPLQVPVGREPVIVPVYCQATDISGGVSDKLGFTLTMKVSREVLRSRCRVDCRSLAVTAAAVMPLWSSGADAGCDLTTPTSSSVPLEVAGGCLLTPCLSAMSSLTPPILAAPLVSPPPTPPGQLPPFPGGANRSAEGRGRRPWLCHLLF
jgi:hypothetical protein